MEKQLVNQNQVKANPITNMEKQIKHLKTIIKAEKFVVTGSYALKLLGFNSMNSSSDLDLIVVKPTEETLELLARLQKEYPAKTKPTETSSVNYIFMLEGVKVDVFAHKVEFKENTLKLPEYEITNLKHIVASKKRYGRMKDYLQLRNLAREIFKDEDFKNYINNLTPEQLSNQSFNRDNY